MKNFAVGFFAALWVVPELPAQVVNDGANNTLSNVTNQFEASGNFSFANGIAPGKPERGFRIRTP